MKNMRLSFNIKEYWKENSIDTLLNNTNAKWGNYDFQIDLRKTLL